MTPTDEGVGHDLIVEHLGRRFGSVAAVHDVSFRAAPGEFVALLGPSGCGKTTLLRMIAGLETPTSGAIRLDGAEVGDLPAHKRGLGFVFQNYALFPHLTVAENVAFGLEMRHVPDAERRRRVSEVLRLVHLEGFERRRIGQLSGGQQQRVAVARALVIRPKMLLLDEPFSNLDAQLRLELRFELRELQRRLNVTTLFVTHDQTEAVALADRLVVMRAGEIAQVGPPIDVFTRPVDRWVATFVGRGNLLDGQVRTVDGQRLSVQIGEATCWVTAGIPTLVPGERVTVMVRPHHVELSTPRSGQLRGRVKDVQFLGDHFLVVVDVAGGAVEAWTPVLPSDVGLGREVALAWSTEHAVVLPTAGKPGH
jgi:putative spermidine/putrescine transport system ATP-binding protein